MTPVKDLLAELAGNLRWIWNGEFDPLFGEIDPDLWVEVNHNPTAFLLEVDHRKLEERASDPHYRVRLERACHSLRAYSQSDKHWVSYQAPGLSARPVAYFSAEFGLHESLPIYSGGLGVLAGDYLKSSSDLGLPIWGITILYRDGYFTQRISPEGHQEEEYNGLDMSRVAMERTLDAEGKPLSVSVNVDGGKLDIDVWVTRVGRGHLLLLDGYGGAHPDDRFAYCRRLYGGDLQTRLMQEIILGVGGLRALRKMGKHPGAIHMNEGHSALAGLEAIALTMEEEGLSFHEALDQVRSHMVFTTHTPVAAGHDRFPPELMDQHLTPLRERLGLSRDEFLDLGRVQPGNQEETFCMTVLALKLAHRSNGVSSKHGIVSRRMWHGLWPHRGVAEVPIGHVTNGVHVPSWIAPKMAEFLSRNLGQKWHEHLSDRRAWEGVENIDPFEIWDTKSALKKELLSFVEKNIRTRRKRLSIPNENVSLNPDALTIGFARRFVEYKRHGLLFRDIERLEKILANPERPVQILYAGKAHPKDNIGKDILRRTYELSQDPRFQGRIFVLENYDMYTARQMIQGCDLWLNTPRAPLEACGTSGQKAIFNGTLNFSSLDGWWAEAYDKRNGYAFGGGLTHKDSAWQDERDAKDLLYVLENRVIPDFFERSSEGVPMKWIARIKRALVTLGCRYNSDRMVMDYVRQCYLSTMGSLTAEFPRSG